MKGQIKAVRTPYSVGRVISEREDYQYRIATILADHQSQSSVGRDTSIDFRAFGQNKRSQCGKEKGHWSSRNQQERDVWGSSPRSSLSLKLPLCHGRRGAWGDATVLRWVLSRTRYHEQREHSKLVILLGFRINHASVADGPGRRKRRYPGLTTKMPFMQLFQFLLKKIQSEKRLPSVAFKGFC